MSLVGSVGIVGMDDLFFSVGLVRLFGLVNFFSSGSFGASWAVFGGALERLGGVFRGVLGRLGGVLGASWAILDASWESCRFSNDLKPS